MLNTFADFIEAEKTLSAITANVTPDMIFGIEPIPDDIQAQVDDLNKQIYDFKHSFPFAVRECCEGKYHTIAAYANADDAIANCPDYDADVYNVITNGSVFTAPDSFTF